MMAGCPDAGTLAELVDRTLPPETAAEVRAHLDECDGCRETVAELVRTRRAPAAEPETTARVEPAPAPWPPARGPGSALEPGTLFAKRFEIELLAGGGGMSRVYRARDQLSGARVALKIIEQPEAAERFGREAELLAAVRHPAVVAYVAHGVSNDGECFLAMEWLDGIDLAGRLRAGPLTIGETVTLFRRVVGALAPAHARGIVHRDVKPSNLFLPDGDVRRTTLLDFGIARRAVGMALTRAGVLVGTPGYMAPEQVRGERQITPAADVFALGCVLYECLTGLRPFAAPHVAAALVRVLFDDATPIRALCPALPAALDDLIERMLRKAAADRPRDAAALSHALRAIAVVAEPPSAPAPPRPPALTDAEQGLYSVVVALPPAAGLDGTTLVEGRTQPPAQLVPTLRAMGAQVDMLADGTLIAVVAPIESAPDQAVLAARIGLAVGAALPEVRVGVATGRGHLHRQHLIGDALERALRLLEGTHEAGVWVDELSANLMAGRIAVQTHGGGTQIRPDDPNLDEAQRLLGLPTPCVGREQELALLEAALAGCIDERSARAVGVVAPPGMGKSRLRHELLRRARLGRPELAVIHGRADLMAAGSPYAIVSDGFLRRCGVGAGAALVEKQARIQAHVAGLVAPEHVDPTCHFLGQMCGGIELAPDHPQARAAKDDPRLMNAHVGQAFIRWLGAECAAAPVLLVLEDLHWGDALTVQLCERLLRELRDVPLLVLALARPEVRQLFPSFWDAQYLQELPLRGLSSRASERLVVDVLGRAGGAPVDAGAVARVVAQSAGHPLYLEELIRAVAAGMDGALPETVLAMLQARLSHLDPLSRRVLRAASVFGERFGEAGVRDLLGDDVSATALEQALGALVRGEVVERSDALGDYKFRHGLVRDAAYGLLTEKDRAQAHQLAERHLDQLGDVDPAVLAEHAEKGGLAARAGQHWLRAAERANARFDLAATERFVAAALVCPMDDATRAVARALAAVTKYKGGDLMNIYEQALATIGELRPGSRHWAYLQSVVFFSMFMTDSYDGVEERVALLLAQEPDDDARVPFLEAGGTIGVMFSLIGARRAARAAAAKMQAIAGKLAPSQRGYFHAAESWRLNNMEPEPGRALDEARVASAIGRANDDAYMTILGWFHEGLALAAVGDYAEGERVLAAGAEHSLRAGAAALAAISQVHLGLVLAEHGEPAGRARAVAIASALKDLRHAGRPIVGMAWMTLARVHLADGKLDEAARAQAEARDNFAPQAVYRFEIDTLEIQLQLARGQPSAARRCAEEALERLAAIGGVGYPEVGLRAAIAEARFADGDAAAGRDAMTAAHDALTRRADQLQPVERAHFLARADSRAVLALRAGHGL
jgi:hypothetical protein